MAYLIKGKGGQPIMKDGKNVFGSDLMEVKLLEMDDTEGTFVARASDAKEDRDKDILHQDGFDLKNFKKNPVIPWSHNYWEPPVAKSIKTWVDDTLMFKPKFDMEDDFARKIFNKYKNGFLTSFSVGFIGLEFQPRDEKDPWWGGREFTKMELLEISCVTVPANPRANVHVNAVDGGIKSLAQDGYPDRFAKMPNGNLFYPIRDVGEFSFSKSAKINGVEILYGKSLSDQHPEKGEDQIIGYSFIPDYETAKALSFVKDYSFHTRKVWGVELNVDGEKGNFVVQEVVSEEPIQEFSEYVDFTGKEAPVVSAYRIPGEKVLEDEPKTEEPDEQKTEESDDQKTEESVIEEPENQDAPSIKVEVDMSKLEGFVDWLKRLEEVVNRIDDILNKKSVDSQNGSCDNNSNVIGELDESNPETKATDDDSFEIEESLLTPEEKSSDDSETIVIDVQDMEDIRQLAKSASVSLANSFGTKLADTLRNSGRID